MGLTHLGGNISVFRWTIMVVVFTSAPHLGFNGGNCCVNSVKNSIRTSSSLIWCWRFIS